MNHPVFALDTMSTLKDVLAIIGAVGTVLGTAFGIWLTVRKSAAARRQQERQEDQKLSARFTDLQKNIVRLETQTGSIESNYNQFRDDIETTLKELGVEVESLRKNGLTATNGVSDLNKDVQRIQDQLDNLGRDLIRYREQITDKYVTLAAHRNDLLMISNNFDTLRQDLRSIVASLNKGKNS